MIDRYTRPEMGAIWSFQNKFEIWKEIEILACEAQAELGDIGITREEAAHIRATADFTIERIDEIEATTNHDVIAFLTNMAEYIGEESKWVHYGMTSSDLGDTALCYQITQAMDIVLADVRRIGAICQRRALEFKDTLCVGRTHGIHAEPTSYGLKFAGFHAEMRRHKERFAAAWQGVRVGKISGAVGTYAHLNPEVERLACEILGLEADPVSTQIIQRDRHAAFFTALAVLAGGVERLCVELRHLQRTEVLEVEEGFAAGQKGSSAMPHKRNPISAENLTGLSRLLRGNALAAMENQALWHERDISHSSVERVIMPDCTILADYILARLAGVLRRLRVIPANIERNLKGSYGLFYSQRVLMALLEETDLGRQEAYELVQRVAMRCWEQGLQFPEQARADADIARLLPAGKLDEVFDPGYYLRHEDMIFNRVFGG